MADGASEPSGLNDLEKQVEALLEEHSSAAEILSRLDFQSVENRDCYTDWHASLPLIPMIRALLFREIHELNYSELHRHLSNNPETSSSFGFDKIPARTTFGRAWKDRFDEDLRDLLRVGAERIRQIGRRNGILIGSRSIKPRDKKNVSKRTEDRYISEKAEEVTKEMQRLVYPVFEFGRAENARYDTDAFLELQSHLGLTHSAAESGTKLFNQDSRRESGSPDADTHLHNIKQLDREKIGQMINVAIGRMATEAKRHLQFNRPVDVAIDMTYVAYYGKRDELEMVYGAPPSKSYDWCFKFATLTVVGENIKLTLAVRPVQVGEQLVGETVRDLLEQAKEHVPINMVYADSEFCSVETIRVLDELGVNYVIPSPKRSRINREIDHMRRDTKVMCDWIMHGNVSDGKYSQPAYTNIILLPSTKNEDNTVAFITNAPVDNYTEASRRAAKGLVNRYSRRWGIENSYKTIKDFLAWTTSKEFVVRYFYFGFAVLLYNMWLLVDLIVQLSLDVEHRYKPRVTAKRFLNLARKYLIEPG